ncbi:MAG: hypothetical protein KAI64_07700 [Thermoplasmata archaeon]|nr:hypothetical protein [Thermoplasmata archaeon]
MPIKHFELSGIDVKRFIKRGEKVGQVRIDHNSTVTLITEVNDKEANIDFRFTATYSGLGFIKIEGRMIYEGEAAKLAKEWSTSGKMPNEVANEVHTTIMSNCIPDAVILAKEVRLPPPLPIPKINIQAGKGKPSSGIEVA